MLDQIVPIAREAGRIMLSFHDAATHRKEGHFNYVTDADVAVITGAGVKTGLVSIPLKNMHTAAEMVQISDIEAVADLMAAYALA